MVSGSKAHDSYPYDMASESGEPWQLGFAIEPSDDDELPEVTRDIYVGVAGDVRLVLKGGAELTFRNAVAGFRLGLSVRKVFATGTTAAALIGLY